MTTETFIPPSASADGKRNAYYTDCKPQEQKRPYAACLNTIALYSEGKLNSMYSPCETAIRNGQCRAVGMRQEEELKGVAIYFIERPRAENLQGAGAGEAMRKFFDSLGKGIKAVFSPEPVPAPAPVVKKPKSLLDSIEAPDYAMAITDMAAEASAPKKSIASAGPAPGDSPLDRMIAAAPLPVPKPAGMPTLVIRPGESPLEAIRRMKAASTTTEGVTHP